jgi:diguanylate cyclase (GGDEF)-like protein/PAS domain S-box-containing protein
MRDSERRFRALFEGMAEGVVLQREDGGIVSCNPAAEEILGLTADQMIGRTSLDPRWHAIREDGSPFPGDEHPAIVTLKTGRPLRDVLMGVRRGDGSERWISIASQPLPAMPGVGGGMVITTFSDVTARREGEMTAAADAAEKAALTRVATLAAGEAPPSAVFAVAAEQAARSLGGELGEVVRDDRDRNPMVVGVWSRRDALRDGRRPMAALDAEVVATSAAARALARRRTSSTWRRDAAPGDGVEVAARCLEVAAPIRVGGRVWGAIAVAAHGAATLTRDSGARIERFAELVGLAVAGARDREALERLAATDDLTGLLNHRAFRARLDDEVARARRHDRPLSLIAIDLDHFKSVNDEHGHPVGDRVLTAVARRLGESVREGEVLARVGGEEFAWLLPETDVGGARAAAERVRASVARAPLPEVGRLTISAGVCELEGIGTAAELIRRADAALYAAKEGGRDRVSAYEQTAPTGR